VRWSHIATNFDRDGNATTYINGQQVGAYNIAPMVAEVFETARFYARTVLSTLPAEYNGTLGDMTTYHAGRYVVGPIAFHTRLVTLEEIRSSYRGKRVQNFGTPTTVVCWDWRNIERLDGEPICWDFEGEDTHHHSTLIGMEEQGIAAPRGAAGTIRVPDLSGTGNHWVLPTLATYRRTAALDELSSMAFLTDPFWMT